MSQSESESFPSRRSAFSFLRPISDLSSMVGTGASLVEFRTGGKCPVVDVNDCDSFVRRCMVFSPSMYFRLGRRG